MRVARPRKLFAFLGTRADSGASQATGRDRKPLGQRFGNEADGTRTPGGLRALTGQWS